MPCNAVACSLQPALAIASMLLCPASSVLLRPASPMLLCPVSSMLLCRGPPCPAVACAGCRSPARAVGPHGIRSPWHWRPSWPFMPDPQYHCIRAYSSSHNGRCCLRCRRRRAGCTVPAMGYRAGCTVPAMGYRYSACHGVSVELGCRQARLYEWFRSSFI